MAESYDVEVTVVSQKGSCGTGHEPGDKWVINGSFCPTGMCGAAYHVLFPDIRVYRFGGVLPWTKDPDACQVACPDNENPVVFEIRRIKKK